MELPFRGAVGGEPSVRTLGQTQNEASGRRKHAVAAIQAPAGQADHINGRIARNVARDVRKAFGELQLAGRGVVR